MAQISNGNIDLKDRPIVNNPDGSFSTESSKSFNIDGKEVLMPTIINGKRVSDQQAIEHYNKTGENLGRFDTIDEANSSAEKIHNRFDITTAVPAGGDGKSTSVFDITTAMPISPKAFKLEETSFRAPDKIESQEFKSKEQIDTLKARAVVEQTYREKDEDVPISLRAEWYVKDTQPFVEKGMLLATPWTAGIAGWDILKSYVVAGVNGDKVSLKNIGDSREFDEIEAFDMAVTSPEFVEGSKTVLKAINELAHTMPILPARIMNLSKNTVNESINRMDKDVIKELTKSGIDIAGMIATGTIFSLAKNAIMKSVTTGKGIIQEELVRRDLSKIIKEIKPGINEASLADKVDVLLAYGQKFGFNEKFADKIIKEASTEYWKRLLTAPFKGRIGLTIDFVKYKPGEIIKALKSMPISKGLTKTYSEAITKGLVDTLPAAIKETISTVLAPKKTVADFNQEKQPLAEKDIKVEQELVDKVNIVQEELGADIKISSGFRTKEYNEFLKTLGYNPAEDSLHIKGRAADIKITDGRFTHEEVLNAARKAGLDVEDITLTPHHIHVELPTKGTPTKLQPPKISQEEIAKLKEDVSGILDAKPKAEPTTVNKLKQQIYANAAVRGLPKTQVNDLIKKLTGKGSIDNKSFTEDELQAVLGDLKKLRPKHIGARDVVTKKTEKAIQAAKENMLKNKEITQEIYDNILSRMDIIDPRYVGSFQYITEQQGKELLHTMRYLADINKEQVKLEEAYSKNEPAKKYVDLVKESVPEEPIVTIPGGTDAHHAYDSLELQTGLPFGRLFEKTRHDVRVSNKELADTVKKVFGETQKDLVKITKNPEALERMQQYIGFQRPDYIRGKPEYPKGITDKEKDIVDKMIKFGESFQNEIRYERTLLWIKDGTRIPNAPARELTKAREIYLTEGKEALKEWLKNKSWGVVTGGAYDFGEAIKGKIRLYKPKAGAIKKGLASKETIQYKPYDRDLVNRFMSYARGVILRKNLRDDVLAIKSLAELIKPQLLDPSSELNLIERNLLEILGQNTSTPQIYEKFLVALYSQAARTLFADPRKGVRNLFQNAALLTGIEDIFRLSSLSKADNEFFDTFISQDKSIKQDFLYSDVKINIPLLKNLNEWADMLNVMGRTDTVNRYIAFKATLNKVKGAIKNNPDYMSSEENFYKFIKESGIADLNPMERVHAIDRLVTDGPEAFAHYLSKAVTEKVHFLYTRFERGFAEQGAALSKILTNLWVFKKGYIQRLVYDVKKLRPSQSKIETPVGGQVRGARSAFFATVGAAIVGGIYMKVTGDTRNPYSPITMVTGISLGGLATGSQEKLNEFSGTVVAAAFGDKKAMAKLPAQLTSMGDFTIPFYDFIINVIESLTDTVDIDRKKLRQIREKFDKEYELREGDYQIRRTRLEKFKHAFFGTDPEEQEPFITKIGSK